MMHLGTFVISAQLLNKFLYTSTNPATNYSRPSPFHVGKMLIYAMPNPHYHKIDLKAP